MLLSCLPLALYQRCIISLVHYVKVELRVVPDLTVNNLGGLQTPIRPNCMWWRFLAFAEVPEGRLPRIVGEVEEAHKKFVDDYSLFDFCFVCFIYINFSFSVSIPQLLTYPLILFVWWYIIYICLGDIKELLIFFITLSTILHIIQVCSYFYSQKEHDWFYFQLVRILVFTVISPPPFPSNKKKYIYIFFI